MFGCRARRVAVLGASALGPPSRLGTDEVERSGECLGDLRGRRGAAGDVQIDGQDRFERTGELVGIAEDPAAERAIAQSGDEAGFGHRVVGGSQRLGHARRDRAGDEQHVGVPRRGDDVQAEALEIVDGVGGGGQLVLAAVAGAGVDVAQRQRAAREQAPAARSGGAGAGGGGGGRTRSSGRRRRSRARSSC